MASRRVWAAGALIVGLAACAPAASRSEAEVLTAPLTRLGVPPADYFGAAWITSRSIVVAWRPPSDDVSNAAHLVSIDPGASSHSVLPFAESDDECWRAQEVRPVRLPDTRLGFIRECQPREFEGIDYSIDWLRVWAADLQTGKRELLADLGDPSVYDGGRILYSFSYRPGLTEGVAYLGTRICDGVALFDSAGVRPFDFRIGQGADAPNLNEPFEQQCQDTINASDSVWSPDGARIAVLVSTQAKGRDGFDRLDLDWDLLVLDPSTGRYDRLLSGLRDPHSVAWSPDGRWIAVGETEDETRSTTWLVRAGGQPSTKRLDISERVTSLAWSPGSDALFGLVDPTPSGDPADFAMQPVTFDLSILGSEP